MTEKTNAKQFPKIFYCRHMLPGVCRYEGIDKETGKSDDEMVFLDADTMKRAAPTFPGKPVYVLHQKVNLQNIQQDADGYVTDCFYNEVDGWLWAKFIAVSDEAHQAVERQWSVSNAYIPTAVDGPGQHLNVDYHNKIRDYRFTHLAIVPNPRYEEAKIYTPEEFKAYQASKRTELEELQNSKQTEEISAMAFFRTAKQEIKAGDTILDTDFTEIKNDDGTTEVVTVGDLKKAKLAEKANSKKNEKMVDDDEEVEVDGEKVNMAALKDCYKNMKKNEKKNSEKKNDDKKKEEEEAEKKDKEMKNAEEEKEKEKKKKEEEEEKENAKRFKEFQNAHSKGKSVPLNTVVDKKQRGTELFGSGTK